MNGTPSVVREGSMGRSPKASHATLLWPKSSHIALLEGNMGRFRPILPSVEGNMGRPPALGKKEGGKQFWSPEGQYGTLLPIFVSKWRTLSQIPAWSKEGGEGVPNEGLLDLMSVDLVFFWIESRHFRQNRLVLCGLRFFLLDLQANGVVDLDFFCSDFRLVQANGVVDLDFFCSDFRLVQANGVVDLDFFWFAGFAGKQAVNLDFFKDNFLDLYQFVVLIMRLTNLYDLKVQAHGHKVETSRTRKEGGGGKQFWPPEGLSGPILPEGGRCSE